MVVFPNRCWENLFPGIDRHAQRWAELGLREDNNFLIIKDVKGPKGLDKTGFGPTRGGLRTAITRRVTMLAI